MAVSQGDTVNEAEWLARKRRIKDCSMNEDDFQQTPAGDEAAKQSRERVGKLFSDWPHIVVEVNEAAN